MKKTSAIALISLISFNSHSFEDFVQDIDANETIISSGLSFSSQDTTFTGPGGSLKENSDMDNVSFTLVHSLEIESESLVGFGVEIDEASSEGESEQTITIGAHYTNVETSSSDAYSLQANYLMGDTDGYDEASFSFSKQLKSDTNLQLDGEIIAGYTLPISPDEFSGGNNLTLALAGRLKVSDKVRVLGGAALVSVSDIEYDNGVTASFDPSVSLFIGTAYELLNNVVVDVMFVKGGTSGALADSINDVDIETDFSTVLIGFDVLL